MIPKHEQRWAVTKSRMVFGPGKISESAFGLRFSCNEGGDRISNLKIFPTEAEARAYAERKPWWQRVKAWYLDRFRIRYSGSLAFLGYAPLNEIEKRTILGNTVFLIGLGAAFILAAWLLTACDSTTAPVEQTCKTSAWSDSAQAFVLMEIPCNSARVAEGESK